MQKKLQRQPFAINFKFVNNTIVQYVQFISIIEIYKTTT